MSRGLGVVSQGQLQAVGRAVRAAGIAGMGVAIPDRVMTNADLERLVDTSDEWIVTRTGIRERRIASEDVAASDLAYAAAREALDRAGVAAADVDLIIVATTTPDMPFPATACLVQHKLGAVRAGAFDLEAACSGFLYALAVGSQFIRAGTYETVLVIGAEVLSRIINWQDRSTCVLMGDGAAAAVLRPAPDGAGILSTFLGADGGGGDLLKMAAGGSRLPASPETVARGLHYLYMNGREVYKFAVNIMGDAAERALALAGLTAADVDWFVPHQANLRIIEAAARRFDLPMDKVVVNLDRYGNTSAASVPIALHEAVQDGRIRSGDVVLAVAFGAGLTWGAAVMRWV